MKLKTLCILLFVLSFILIQHSHAGTFGMPVTETVPLDEDEKSYVGFGSGFVGHQLPEFTWNSTVLGEPSPYTPSSSNFAYGGEAGFTFGKRFDKSNWLSKFGQNTRLEGSLAYGRSWADAYLLSTDIRNFSITASDVAGAGEFPIAYSCEPRCTISVDVETLYQTIEGAVRVKTDMPISKNIYLTPGLGIVSGKSLLEYRGVLRRNIGAFYPSNFETMSFINENLTTYRIGIEPSIDMNWEVMPKWTVISGISGSIFYMKTE